MDGTTTIPTELEAAERALRRVAAELTTELRRKLPKGDATSGHWAPYVEFWVGGRDVVAFIGKGRDRQDDSNRLPTLAEAVDWARAKIAAIPDPDEARRLGWLTLGVDPAEAA